MSPSRSSDNDGLRSVRRGESTSVAELSNVSPQGLTILVDGRELHLPFEDFPWFRAAPIRALAAIERPSPQHLRRPELDVDLTIESIEHPERYPLIANQ